MFNAGLILEGGGMRGLYTAGVLDFFIDKDIYFPSVYGVSAGSCQGSSYLSKQSGRGYHTIVDYLHDKRFCSMYSLIRTGDMFGAEMCYDIIPNQLNLFDYDTYNKYEGDFYAVVTNCRTGEAEYIKIKDMKKDVIAIRASSSLPLVSRMVEINGQEYLDGGIADSIPLQRSIEDGNQKNVVVLTQMEGYRKSQNSMMSMIKFKYRKYPKLIESIETRHVRYNETLDAIKEKEKNGEVFVIRPSQDPGVRRTEKDMVRLERLYKMGYEDAKGCWEGLRRFLGE